MKEDMFSQEAQIDPYLPVAGDATAVTCRQFTLFSKLPYELQMNIWKNSIPDPQIIRLKLEVDKSFHESDSFIRDGIDWDTDQISCINSLKISAPFSKAPGLLGACRNSRAAILAVYKGVLKAKDETVIRFDPESDTIFLLPIQQGKPICQCRDAGGLSTAEYPSNNTRKSMLLGLGTQEIPRKHPQRSRDFSAVVGGIKKLIMVWGEFFCVHSADITWTLSNFSSLQELTLVTPVRKDAYCSSYLQAVGSPTIWCVEQISSHFDSAEWLVKGLRNDMMCLERFKYKLESRKSLFYRDWWKLPKIIRFGGCYIDWVEGKE
ncbi:hypothetical protein GcC1_052019 [Golovinomyces cichoracearum]|uniref:2EXR domain-containing protein n=1 Tax=Golovinomyces cichoracearum TaxID=62708 RepID=A0A420IWB8_9PEZI|nr:hypothetical protein GcC1_052019 [Golovinomyces cichoracearum]